jgi:hypothetical protein
LRSTYGTGSDGRDMGELTCEVSQNSVGEMTQVGASVGITRVVHTLGPRTPGNKEVGFFDMIDATDLRTGYAKDDEEQRGQVASSGYYLANLTRTVHEENENDATRDSS